MEYFEARGVDSEMYADTKLPAYYKEVLESLPADARILDFGCGFGQTLNAIKNKAFSWGGGEIYDKQFMLFGVDINQKAIDFVQSLGIEAMVCSDIFDFIPDEKFDLIITTHVMEHLPKDKIIPALAHFKNHMLKPGGKIFVAVPNAQSHTGCYWAYEDFTHNTLFTAGSLIYVLKMAGFSQVEIIDPQAMAGTRGVKRLLRKIFLRLYEFQYSFWNRMTSSAFHAPSPKVFSYEIKALAANQDNSIKDKHENTAKTAAF